MRQPSGDEMFRLLDSLAMWLMGEAIPLPGRTHSDDQLARDLRLLSQAIGRPSLPRDTVLWRGVNVPRELAQEPGLVKTAENGRLFQSWSTNRQAAIAFARASVHEDDGGPRFGYLYEARAAPNAGCMILSVPDVCSFLRDNGSHEDALETISMFESSEEVILMGNEVFVESITAIASPDLAPGP